MADEPTPPTDPGALLLTKNYRMLFVLSGVIGVLVSLASWGFLELIHFGGTSVNKLAHDSRIGWQWCSASTRKDSRSTN